MTKTEKAILQRLGIYLKKIRSDKGFSLRDLETYSGVDNSMISKLERGNINPSVLTMIKLANALEVSVCELLSFAG